LIFTTLYTTLTSLILIVSSPVLAILSFKRKYQKSIPARFFLWKNFSEKRDLDFWLHGCSLGEINSLKPFAKEFSKRGEVLITATTETGFNSAKNSFQTAYLPFEPLLYFWKISTKNLIVLEAELWYLLFFVAKKRGAKTILLSARLSDRSFPKYKKFGWFYKKLFKNIDLILAQSEIDKERFLSLGAENVQISGNIKLLKSEKRVDLDISKEILTIVGASTHKNDEKLILDAFQKYGKGRLIIVPRHIERFDDVWKFVKSFGEKYQYSTSRYSENENFKSKITLVDKIGLLIDIYAKSDIVILGGAFSDGIGGHNPVEPASFQNKIISGKYMFNQKELLKYISNLQIVEGEDILKALQNCENLEYSQITQDIDFEKIVNLIT
jgi:3-deoxy-D-manno-octulosonic-acid transferase